jgi:hypothetical protein
LWITPTGTVNIPFGGLNISPSLTITGGTVTANNPVLSATQTWNNAAVTFTGWQLNVTDTASNAASLLMNLRVSGGGGVSLEKSGRMFLFKGGATETSFFTPASYNLTITAFNAAFDFSTFSGFRSPNGIALGANFTNCVRLDRDADDTLAQRRGVNAQAFRIYNTFTDASNYERGFVRWVGNAFQIGNEFAGTGLARNFAISAANNLTIDAAANLTITAQASLTLRSNNNASITLSVNGVNRWAVDGTSGHIVAVADNAYDIGAAAASRPRNLFLGSYMQLSEMTAPAAPAANNVVIYAVDNGSGKTQLMALFATGAAQQIAIEP